MSHTPLRLLFTGGRDVTDRYPVVRALSNTAFHLRESPGNRDRPVVLVHGGSVDKAGGRVGADWIADNVWRGWAETFPELAGVYLPPEVHPAADHKDPLTRNAYMVGLGADACVAVATRWASGTGNCARLARKAGIPTQDFGVDTLKAPAQ